MGLSSDILEASRRRLQARFGDGIAPWWAGLTERLSTLESLWEIGLGEPIDRGNTSLVIRCRLPDGRPAILKMTPDPELARAEARALRSWSPSGRVPVVLGYDEKLGALLLEAFPNETPLAELGVSVDLEDVAELIGALHQNGAPVIGEGVTSLTDRVEFMFNWWFDRQAGTAAVGEIASQKRVERGYRLARALASQSEGSVLLHGDLHAYNVLEGGDDRGLVAIDPRPCVGDPAFDAVDWVFWPKDHPDNWAPRCARLSAALDVDPARVWEWCRTFAAMLAATATSQGGDATRIQGFLELAP